MGNGMQNVLRGIIQAGMYLAYRPKVIYKNDAAMEVMNSDAPVVFICNHMSHKDGALMASVLHKKKPYFLIAKDWYEKKQFEVFLRTYGSVPVDRTGMDTAWFDACRKLLKSGHSILIFPEGKTSKGEMNEFQPGFAVLAEKTGSRVVECAHAGEYHLFFGKRKYILIGDSYCPECPRDIRKSLYAKQVAGQARERIRHMKEMLEAAKTGKSKPAGGKTTREAAATEEPQQES